MTAGLELGPEPLGCGIERIGIRMLLRPSEVETVDVSEGYDVDVGVGNFEAGDHQADADGTEGRLLGGRDHPGDFEEMRRDTRVEIDPVVDLGTRYDQGVPGRQRVDGQEADGDVVPPHEAPGELAGDDAAEDAGHAVTVALRGDRGAAVYARTVRVWTIPNAVSALRLAAVPVFVWLLFGVGDRGAAAWTLAALGATDWVDGFLARRLDQVSELGKVLDPIADRLALVVGIGAIVIDGSAPLLVAGAVLVREALVSGLMAARTVLRRPKLAVNRLGKTGTFFAYFAFPMWLGGNSTLSYANVLEVSAWAFAVPGVVAAWVSLAQYARGGVTAAQGPAPAN